MDPLSITASTITVIQSILAVYDTIQHIKGLPKAFKEVGQSLPLVRETLELARDVLDTDNPDDAVKTAIRPALIDCKKRANTIKEIFDEIDKNKNQKKDGKDAKDWSAFVRFYRKKIAPLGKAHKVEALMQDILKKLKVLAIHQIFKSYAEFQSQVEKLEKAIKALSEVEPSLPDSDFDGAATSYTQNNSDNARGFISTGSGAEISMGDRFQAGGDMNFAEFAGWLRSVSRPLRFEKVQLEMSQISQRTPGAGKWLLKSPQFKKWRDGHIRRLWCRGNPGTGKTVLASTIVDYLRSRFASNDRVAFVYVYFDYRRQHEQTLSNTLSSLLQQLLQIRDAVSNESRDLHKDCKATRLNPSDEDYLRILKSEMAAFRTVYMVVDALDECLDDIQTRTLNGFMRACRELPQQVQMLFTSRNLVKFDKLVEPDDKLEIVADDHDIKAYLVKFIKSHNDLNRVVELGVSENASFRENTLVTIVKKSQGMFLLAHLHIESLASTHDLAGFKHCLSNLSTSPDAFYAEALGRIENQVPAWRELAFKALTWLVHAQRPLTVEELSHALAIQDSFSGIQSGVLSLPRASETLGREEALTSACAGIAVVVPGSGMKIVRLAHTSAEKYLRDQNPWFFGEAHQALAKTCLCCLLATPSPSKGAADETYRDYPLFRYSANHWGSHMSESSGTKGDLLKLAWAFVSNKTKLNESIRFLDHLSLSRERDVSGLHVSAYFGLGELVTKAISKNKSLEVNAQTQRKETPLHWATDHGQWDFMELLVAQRADLNVPNVNKQTALHRAVILNDKDATRILLASKRVNLELQDSDGYTCLRRAAKYGQHETVEMLLAAGAEVDACDEDGYTALRWAAHGGYLKIVKMLLRRKASIETPSKDKWTLLRWAAQEGREDIVRFLIDRRANLDVVDDDGMTALRWAVDYNRTMAAWLLIQAGADVNRPDQKDFRPLHAVAKNCCASSAGGTVKQALNLLWLLLENQADVDARTKHHGETALHLAAVGGSGPAVRLLLGSGADPGSRDAYDRTALHCAVGCGHLDVSRALAEQAGDLVHAADHESRTALHGAASLGDPAMVEMLLAKGARVDARDGKKQTALHISAALGAAAVVEKLLAAGAQADARDRKGQGPLHVAAFQGNSAAVEGLLAGGANVDLQDEKGRTPLHLAIMQRREEAVECLVRGGADPSILTTKKVTAARMAAASENWNIVNSVSQGREVPKHVRFVETVEQKKWDKKYAATVEDGEESPFEGV
ncbi:hypothetical protein CSOJ01_05015 [Colletotrichum sojae]|uniref:NACHT domain-containing protein n=1 Tax=Colletotrichum sojae TaxID=2175907 RepID=A0A8H6MXI8_9PEZI|nr:hypothetical protein CSOJ01_05015 [Colletotrichum sojae]